MFRRVIGLGYKAGVGKDSVAQVMSGWGWTILHFADPLKEAVGSIFQFSEEQLYGSEKGKLDNYWNTTPRRVFQVFGTEAMQGYFGKDIWVKALKKRMSRLDGKIVIADVRFPHEALFVKSLGGSVVRVDRPGYTQQKGSLTRLRKLFTKGWKGHSSETLMDNYNKWNYILQNDGTLQDLERKTVEMLRSLYPSDYEREKYP